MNIITTNNSKLGGQIAQVNMPYCISCRPDAPCMDDCYCTHGNMAFETVRNAHIKRYQMYKLDSFAFFNQIDTEMKYVSYKYFRWHSAGDIVDSQYLDLMCKLARKHKETHFLCFTKKYELVNDYLDNHRKPSNLVICLSNWGEWRVDNRHNLPTSWVNFGETKGIPEFAYECTGNCGECSGTHCWHMRKGDAVVFYKH